ncbi:MAG: DUF5123 domain-containing protein [Paludibacter sp.]|nr:DUF5123 domain-containing protein [Paludibacter sp.]
MKTIIYKYCLFSFVVLLSLFGLYSCQEVSELQLPRIFQPINFNCSLDKTVATISWSQVDSAKSYTLILSTDSINYSNPIIDTTTTQLSCKKELAGETKYFAKIKANASDSLKNSKFNSKLSFKTPAENIFLGYGTSNNTGKLYSAYMTSVRGLTIKWTPGANVTHFILTNAAGTVRDSVTITPSEAAAGEKQVSSLDNSKWKVQIHNGTILRGTTYGIVEGDVILNDGDNLQAALAGATAGQVILLAGTGNYITGSGAVSFTSSIKLRGLSPTQLPTVCMKTGASATANMFGIPAGAAIDSLIFENLNLTGYCENLLSNTKVAYVFNNKVQCSVTDIKFNNCNIHSFANTVFRLSGGLATGGNDITNLTFNGCIMNDVGTGYAIVNISKSYDYIQNIKFANSTISKFDYPLISIAQTAILPKPINSVHVTNCTFNQSTQSAATKALFSFDFVNITNGITISKCIFGSSGSVSAGLKVTNTTSTPTISVSGCYYTSDFVDETLIASVLYSIKPKMTQYSGKSTDLWVNPVTVSTTIPSTGGDFTLKDTSFAGKGVAGDLRW